MWWAGSESFEAYLGLHGWGWSRTPGTWEWAEAADVQAGLQQLGDRLRGARTGRRLAQWRVWLSGALARPFVFQPVAGVKDRREAREIALRLAPDATGLAAPCEVWLEAPAGPPQAVLAAAVEQSVIDGLQEMARLAGATLSSVRPWWASALAVALDAQPGLGALLVDEPDALTLLVGPEGRFVDAATASPAPQPAEATDWVKRALLISGTEGLHACRARRVAGSCEPALEAWP